MLIVEANQENNKMLDFESSSDLATKGLDFELRDFARASQCRNVHAFHVWSIKSTQSKNNNKTRK